MRAYTLALLVAAAAAQRNDIELPIASFEIYEVKRTVQAPHAIGEVSRYYSGDYEINDETYYAETLQVVSSTISLKREMEAGEKVQTYACNGDN